MASKKLLEALINVLFAKTPSEAVKNALKAAVDQVPSGATQPTWEQLVLQAFDAAVEAMRPQLQRYASPDGEVGLDRERLRAALQGDLALHDLAESDLLSATFQDRLASELFERDALYIGGNKLSRADTWHLIRLLVTKYAPAQFKALIEHNEDAFRQALRREALKHSVQLEEVQGYLQDQMGLLLVISEEIVAVHDDTRAIRQVVEDLPGAVADELEARGIVSRTALTAQRQVFISYARADHADEGRDPSCFVQKLYRALEDAGFTPWLDHYDMPSRGTPFPKELALAIERSERFLAVCGPAYPGSEWAQKERDYAQACCIAITPVLFAGDFETSVPADIVEHRDHVIDMRAGFEQTWPNLLKRLTPPAAIPGPVIDPDRTMP
jgi:hypothetical protein